MGRRRGAQGGQIIAAFEDGYHPGAKIAKLMGEPSVILFLPFQLGEGIGTMGVETGGDQEEIRGEVLVMMLLNLLLTSVTDVEWNSMHGWLQSL